MVGWPMKSSKTKGIRIVRMTIHRLAAVALGLLIAAAANGVAAEIKPSTITVKDMHCGGCAKKIAAELKALAGVDKAEPDVEAKTVKVTPKANVVLSPKALWEAVEKADKTPTKLVGPSGSFTAKPKS
jgi:copper chaperone CopZ